MHRHGYIGRKFGRECDQRDALIKGLATSLVMHGKIETTLPKAKELVRYIEKLITKAKKGDLHYYWDVTGLSDFMIKSIIAKLESEGKMVKFKSANFRIIRW